MNHKKRVSEDRVAVDISLLTMRVIVGIIFVAHGAQKLFGAFGGPGLSGVVDNMGAKPAAVNHSVGSEGIGQLPDHRTDVSMRVLVLTG